jgi:anti-sigma factor RsiW
MANRWWKLGKTEHEFVSEKLSLYMDQQLAALDRARVEQHLSTCAECRQALRSLRWTRQLLRQAPVARVPRSFVIREADVVPARTAGRRGHVLALQWATALVVALLVVVFAGDLYTGGLLMSARQASAPMVAYERAVEKQAVEGEQVVATQEGTPSVVADQALQAAGVPSPTAEAAARMAAPEKKVEATGAAEAAPTVVGAVPVGAEAAPTGTPPPPGAVALSATSPGEQTSTPAAEGVAEKERNGTPPEANATAAEEPQPESLSAIEQPPVGLSNTALVQGREARPASSWRMGWRAAEIGLGAVLLILVITLIWMRLRR